MRRITGWIGACAVVLVGAGLVSCAPAAEPVDTPRDLTIAVPSVALYDPPWNVIAVWWDMPHQATYERLLSYDPMEQDFEPALAESFTWNDDRTAMTIHLRDGVEFSNGVVVDADAVKTLLDALLADENVLGHAEFEKYNVQVGLVDDMTIEITADAAIDVFELYPDFGIADPDVFINSPEGMKDAPVGTGPYLLDEVVPDVSARFVRNPTYWNPDAVEFESVTFKVFTDPIAGLNALKSGQVDVATILPEYGSEAEASGLSIFTPSKYLESAMLVVFDTQGATIPALADVRVRQAIGLAFDRASILENIQNGFGSDSPQLWPEGYAGHVEGGDDRWAYNLDKARELMAEAGYEDGFDLVIPKVAAGEHPQYVGTLEPIVIQSLADIGIRASFEQVGIEDWTFEQVGTGDGGAPVSSFPVGFFQLNGAALQVYIEEKIGTYWKFLMDDKGLDLLGELTVGGPEERRAAKSEWVEYVLDQGWAIPITQAASGIYATQSDIEIDTTFHTGGDFKLEWIHRAK
jgi:peptide/nickel transport system substrate-binding protein